MIRRAYNPQSTFLYNMKAKNAKSFTSQVAHGAWGRRLSPVSVVLSG